MRIIQRIHNKLNWSRRRYVSVVIGLLALGYLASASYHTLKPLPEGLDYTGKLRHAQVNFLRIRLILMRKVSSNKSIVFLKKC